MLTDFKVVHQNKLIPPRLRKGDTHISAIVSVGDGEDIVQGVCKAPGAISEIVLFTGKFNGKPIVGAFFVCENEVEVVQCTSTRWSKS
jgi:hypothetical protein